ncbi:MAG: bifunctional phosphopantothenoylcysteine decarboxylase/phosphopantothenate--cysteine ligase CoaBC, partial [Flavobacteriaceae bacterium]|nr:bifunctional phosphopantothenoylcysteine decarboxylase/phosphopantothenate--cysteine ligase CoaBC [Flavobacteriaceae bacterium]
MSLLRGKRILLGVTGGIAAYKTPYLVRLLKKQGAIVKVILTPSAKDFVTPLTLATVSQLPVVESFVKNENNTTDWNNHVKLSLWADFMIIAPATSNTLSKMVAAQTDNVLMATYTSARCPVFVIPAMDLDMYTHFGQQENLKKLKDSGHFVMDAAHGELASGLVGTGRMPEPEAIMAFIEQALCQQAPLYGKTVIITAGPTYEPIDPVRFIGNHSSGKMGIALAEQAAGLGAQVYLVLGPSALSSSHPLVETISVQTAEEMYQHVHQRIDKCDIAIMSAAVSDYRPKYR